MEYPFRRGHIMTPRNGDVIMNRKEYNQPRGAAVDELLRRVGAPDSAGDRLKKAAADNPAVASALSRLSDSDIEAIRTLLSDRQSLQKLLSSPQAESARKLAESIKHKE